MHSAFTQSSSEEVQLREGRTNRRASMASESSQRSDCTRMYPYGWSNIPPVPSLLVFSTMPMMSQYIMDMPLLPHAALFMLSNLVSFSVTRKSSQQLQLGPCNQTEGSLLRGISPIVRLAATIFVARPLATPTKRTGFEAFAGSVSPFSSIRPKSPVGALGRSKSPLRSVGFSAYAAGGAQAFAYLGWGSRSRSREGSVDGDRSKEEETFGEKLRAGKDKDREVEREKEGGDEEEDSEWGERRVELSEQEVLTGEEEEDTVRHVRGKLFVLSDQNQWRERGTGTLRLNVRRSDGKGARLVMRKDAVYSVILNAPLFRGMRCALAQDPRYIRLSVIEDGATTHYNLRVGNAKAAADLMEIINEHIPEVPAGP
ncbi:hypothetical protein EW146_g9285 [Bondarzewia mesenterica]|uniref:RanBD1 domain-containing protein n=1 Tax=Bondarzewia mesenterica TaxID=1095465 RepID=A0A4S4L9I6_9AGAM|nr:hypothetical protein EW146_g9285 [Bondarzewia mesenterica]